MLEETENDDPFGLLGDSSAPTTPTKTTRGVTKYPGNGPWSAIEHGDQVKQAYREKFGKDPRVTSMGQDRTHDRMRWDHRNAMDIGVHPDSAEGKWLGEYLTSQGIPFTAFSHAIPGQATGPHVHVGNPSHRLGSQRVTGHVGRNNATAIGAGGVPIVDDDPFGLLKGGEAIGPESQIAYQNGGLSEPGVASGQNTRNPNLFDVLARAHGLVDPQAPLATVPDDPRAAADHLLGDDQPIKKTPWGPKSLYDEVGQAAGLPVLGSWDVEGFPEEGPPVPGFRQQPIQARPGQPTRPRTTQQTRQTEETQKPAVPSEINGIPVVQDQDVPVRGPGPNERQDVSAGAEMSEGELYNQWYEARKNGDRATMGLIAKNYLEQYPQGKYKSPMLLTDKKTPPIDSVTVDLDGDKPPTIHELSAKIAMEKGFTPEEAQAYQQETGRNPFYSDVKDEKAAMESVFNRRDPQTGRVAIPFLSPESEHSMTTWLTQHRAGKAAEKVQEYLDGLSKMSDSDKADVRSGIASQRQLTPEEDRALQTQEERDLARDNPEAYAAMQAPRLGATVGARAFKGAAGLTSGIGRAMDSDLGKLLKWAGSNTSSDMSFVARRYGIPGQSGEAIGEFAESAPELAIGAVGGGPAGVGAAAGLRQYGEGASAEQAALHGAVTALTLKLGSVFSKTILTPNVLRGLEASTPEELAQLEQDVMAGEASGKGFAARMKNAIRVSEAIKNMTPGEPGADLLGASSGLSQTQEGLVKAGSFAVPQVVIPSLVNKQKPSIANLGMAGLMSLALMAGGEGTAEDPFAGERPVDAEEISRSPIEPKGPTKGPGGIGGETVKQIPGFATDVRVGEDVPEVEAAKPIGRDPGFKPSSQRPDVTPSEEPPAETPIPTKPLGRDPNFRPSSQLPDRPDLPTQAEIEAEPTSAKPTVKEPTKPAPKPESPSVRTIRDSEAGPTRQAEIFPREPHAGYWTPEGGARQRTNAFVAAHPELSRDEAVLEMRRITDQAVENIRNSLNDGDELWGEDQRGRRIRSIVHKTEDSFEIVPEEGVGPSSGLGPVAGANADEGPIEIVRQGDVESRLQADTRTRAPGPWEDREQKAAIRERLGIAVEGGTTNATTQGQQQGNAGTELPGVRNGADIPAYGGEVRQGPGEQAADSGGAQRGAEATNREGVHARPTGSR